MQPEDTDNSYIGTFARIWRNRSKKSLSIPRKLSEPMPMPLELNKDHSLENSLEDFRSVKVHSDGDSSISNVEIVKEVNEPKQLEEKKTELPNLEDVPKEVETIKKEKNDNEKKTDPVETTKEISNEDDNTQMGEQIVGDHQKIDKLSPSFKKLKVLSLRNSSSFGSVGLQSCESGTEGNEVYFFGIIDILICYELKKKAEHVLKSAVYDKDGISVQKPAKYAQRFTEFMTSIVD